MSDISVSDSASERFNQVLLGRLDVLLDFLRIIPLRSSLEEERESAGRDVLDLVMGLPLSSELDESSRTRLLRLEDFPTFLLLSPPFLLLRLVAEGARRILVLEVEYAL